jgi:8-oxo-dGTP diphosphatase
MNKHFYSNLIQTADQDEIHSYAVGAVVHNSKDQVLLLKRKPDDSFGDLYEMPGGGVEPGEDLQGAIYREVQEETGLTVINVVTYLGKFEYVTSKKKLTRQFNFSVDIKNTSPIQISEHSEYVWCHKSNISDYAMTQEVKFTFNRFWANRNS